jgi:hypothetical protein
MRGAKMGSACLDTIQRRWDNTCRVLFKSELGAISQYAEWLKRNNEPIYHRKSSVSGKEVAYAVLDYAEGSRWIGFDEIDFEKKYGPVSINEIKDVESLADAVSERIYYTGSVILGNSGEVEKSSNISDSFYMYETGKYADCKYLAYSTLGRLCEDSFGCNGIGESQFCIKCYETFKDRRCFELWTGQYCSDCYYSHNLSSCQECFFCFNLKNRSHAIGNLELGADKYRSAKEGLLAQIADELKRKKAVPSLVDIVGKAKPEVPASFSGWASVQEPKMEQNRKPIDEAFGKTARLLFGRGLPFGMDECSAWLQKHTRKDEKCRSCASGKPVFRRDYCCYFQLPKERLLTAAEALELGGKLKLAEGEATGLRMDRAHEAIGKIAFFASEYLDGSNANLIECATSSDSSNCYRSSPIVYSKYCGYCFWPRSSQYVFGSSALLDSEFCINCYQSVKLRRCFEMDSCRDCSDCMFCHNCENVHESMFCFNVKNLRYAIGNAEVGKERYLKIKKIMLDKIASGLEKERKLELDIYNLGAKTGK